MACITLALTTLQHYTQVHSPAAARLTCRYSMSVYPLSMPEAPRHALGLWGCAPEGMSVRRGGASACEDTMQGNGLRCLRPCLQVGLVTYGTHVHVHELGFSECAKAYVFQVRRLCSNTFRTCSVIPNERAHFGCRIPTQHYGPVLKRLIAAILNVLASPGAGEGVAPHVSHACCTEPSL